MEKFLIIITLIAVVGLWGVSIVDKDDFQAGYGRQFNISSQGEFNGTTSVGVTAATTSYALASSTRTYLEFCSPNGAGTVNIIPDSSSATSGTVYFTTDSGFVISSSTVPCRAFYAEQLLWMNRFWLLADVTTTISIFGISK